MSKRYLVSDFETTVNTNKTEVWAAASIDLADETDPENVKVQTSIEDFFGFLFNIKHDVTIYFHNLKFDGSFIISYLLNSDEYTPYKNVKADNSFKKYHNNFVYSINDMGEWYEISIAHSGRIYTFNDSYKLLPFSVEEIGSSFETKYRKLKMEYEGNMHAGGEITPHQMNYIKNDVLVMHEAVNKIKREGLDKMTIGACCLSQYKEMNFFDNEDYRFTFPDLYEVQCPIEGFENADEYIRKSYHGGWCYVKPDRANKLQHNGITCDVNSLYVSRMHSDSGNYYPYGMPHWFKGNIPSICNRDDIYYFVRVKTHFYLKEGYLPTLQIKKSQYYKPNEWLETSDYNGSPYVIDINGNFEELKPELILTQTDFELLKEHYDLEGLEILDGCYFDAQLGLFDQYIDYWADKKIHAINKTDRTLSKLMLNNLYGKFSASNESSYKVFHIGEHGELKAEIIEEHDKTPGYIAVGSAITSYARKFTIDAAQANYDTFCYADTDSIHCTCSSDEVKNAPKHETALNHWKYEATWDEAIFAKQKAYIEHVYEENEKPVDPYYNVKCAGMGKEPKMHIVEWLNDENSRFKLTDFKKGLEVPDNLRAIAVNGGTVLIKNSYKMR